MGPADRNLDVGDCAQDRRQNANITLVAQSPKFSGRTARMLGTGWTFASTVVARSGAPLTIVTGGTDPVTGFGGNSPGTQRVNLVNPNTASPNQGQSCVTAGCVQWLNPASFAAPALGTFGNLGQARSWDRVSGAGRRDSREFAIREQQKIEVRFEGIQHHQQLPPRQPRTLDQQREYLRRDHHRCGAASGRHGRIVHQRSRPRSAVCDEVPLLGYATKAATDRFSWVRGNRRGRSVQSQNPRCGHNPPLVSTISRLAAYVL